MSLIASFQQKNTVVRGLYYDASLKVQYVFIYFKMKRTTTSFRKVTLDFDFFSECDFIWL